MSYLALARKWRPRTFSELVGQDHIKSALINALNQQRLHHAYLFTGTRGVGKTSIARILAKSLNCEQGISSKPCLQCDTCCAIEQGRFIDLIEIDGASKTRVEDTRDLLDNVQYLPTSGRFKIYLIDEVHMLSQHSFNALLKTLEEPPAHVKFILATTDPQKLPITVLSRCLQFNLKHLTSELIGQQLQLILREERFDFEIQAVDILAQAARGSMRDALSLLDQAIAGCATQLNARDVKMLLGYTQQDYALQLLHALADQNASLLLKISHQISLEGGQFQYVLDELLNYLHQIAIYQNVGDINPLINPSSEIQNLAHHISAEDTQLFYQIGLKGREEIHLAPELVIGFNMTLLRMQTFRPVSKVARPSLASYQNSLPLQQPSAPKVQATISPPKMHAEENAPSAITPTMKDSDNSPHAIHQETKDWPRIISDLKLTGLALNAVENAELIAKEGREILLRVAKGHQSLFTPTVLTRLERALSQYYQHQVKITLNSDGSVQASPAQQKEQIMQQKQKNAERALLNDPVFQQLQQEFSAELVKNSIVSLKDDL
ncbi:DNA polymerase III subunit gamma/tau [Legionella gratiana]|nr:DNA polymerase III subunit gamma/tau [Legionella gratiana]